MLISEERKFIFIAVPKTGTTAVESHLMQLDPNIRRNQVPGPDGTWLPVHKHARASEIKQKMGSRMKDYSVIAFVRDPISTVVSKYYYYKVGRGAERAKQKKLTKHIMQTKLRVTFAKMMPLRAWALLYPYSMTYEFLLDADGEMLVDLIGNFDNLQAEFERLFTPLGLDKDQLTLPITNKSSYSNAHHLDDPMLRRIVNWKSATDARIFQEHTSAGTPADAIS